MLDKYPDRNPLICIVICLLWWSLSFLRQKGHRASYNLLWCKHCRLVPSSGEATFCMTPLSTFLSSILDVNLTAPKKHNRWRKVFQPCANMYHILILHVWRDPITHPIIVTYICTMTCVSSYHVWNILNNVWNQYIHTVNMESGLGYCQCVHVQLTKSFIMFGKFERKYFIMQKQCFSESFWEYLSVVIAFDNVH